MRNPSLLMSILLCASLALADDPRPNDAPQDPAVSRLFEQHDQNADGFLDRSELPKRMRDRFDRMDADADGKLSPQEMARFRSRGDRKGLAAPSDPSEVVVRLLDANRDGRLSRDELAAATRLVDTIDTNGNGQIDRDEFVVPKQGGRPGEIITPAAKGERIADKLKVGDEAPDFTLPLVRGQGEVALSSFRDKKPVVLIFASYT